MCVCVCICVSVRVCVCVRERERKRDRERERGNGKTKCSRSDEFIMKGKEDKKGKEVTQRIAKKQERKGRKKEGKKK